MVESRFGLIQSQTQHKLHTVRLGIFRLHRSIGARSNGRHPFGSCRYISRFALVPIFI